MSEQQNELAEIIARDVRNYFGRTEVVTETDPLTAIIASHLPAAQPRDVLAAAWDKAFEGTIVPKSNWPTDPEQLKAHGLPEYPSYFDLFMKALEDDTLPAPKP